MAAKPPAPSLQAIRDAGAPQKRINDLTQGNQALFNDLHVTKQEATKWKVLCYRMLRNLYRYGIDSKRALNFELDPTKPDQTNVDLIPMWKQAADEVDAAKYRAAEAKRKPKKPAKKK